MLRIGGRDCNGLFFNNEDQLFGSGLKLREAVWKFKDVINLDPDQLSRCINLGKLFCDPLACLLRQGSSGLGEDDSNVIIIVESQCGNSQECLGFSRLDFAKQNAWLVCVGGLRQ